MRTLRDELAKVVLPRNEVEEGDLYELNDKGERVPYIPWYAEVGDME